MKHITSFTAFFLLIKIVLLTAVISVVAAPIKKDTSSSDNDRTPQGGEIRLVSATQQGVTLQLTILKSDFKIKSHEYDGKHFQSISFPRCRYASEPGYPHLPMQTTLIGVLPDANFTIKIIESSDYSTYTLKHPLADNRTIIGQHNPDRTAMKPQSGSNSIYTSNRFYPENLAKIGTAGWIRENRVLPFQIYPVQYNPVSGVVKLYHKLVVQVQFNGIGNASTTRQALPRPESSVYEDMFDKLLINPQTAKQWRSQDRNAYPRHNSNLNGTLTTRNSTFSIPSAPGITTPRYKVIIKTTGMYHITASDLSAAGIDISTIKPSTLAISNKGKQIPIYVRNTGNGQTENDTSEFKADGEIIFYAQRLSGEKTYFDSYTDENVYWLTWNAGPGLRMDTKTIPEDIDVQIKTGEINPENIPPIYRPNNFFTRVHAEKDNQFRRFKHFGLEQDDNFQQFSEGIQSRYFTINTLPDLPEDSWFWAQISATEIRNFNFTLAGVAGTGNKAIIRGALHGRSEDSHFTELWLNNDIVIGRQRWTGDIEHRFTNQEISQSVLKNGKNTFGVVIPEDRQLDLVMLNWFEIDYWRTFEAENDVLPFSITFLPDDITGQIIPDFRVVLKNFTNPNIEIYGVDGTRYVGLAPKADEEDNPSVYDVVFLSTTNQWSAAIPTRSTTQP